MSPPDSITSLTPVPDAYVPIIKLMYENVDLDLIFVSLRVNSVSRNPDLRDPAMSNGLDMGEIRSMNGPLVADDILALVPQTKTFRFALRAVKLWARNRGCYGSVFGFPGGVAWALMVARICQLYPYACGSTILSKFFRLMSEWSWHRPVHLKVIEDDPKRPAIRVWNPELNAGDAHHLMPVITPTFPSMCSTHTVTNSTLEIIQTEFVRATKMTDKILRGEAVWKDLFENSPFFTSQYKSYLSVIAAGKDKAIQKGWSGLVQAKARNLVIWIPQSDAGIRLAHPHTSSFKRVHRCPTSKFDDVCKGDLSYWVRSGDPEESQEKPTEADGGDDPIITVYTTTIYIGLKLIDGMF